jgi:hypothetical protein
MTPPTVTSHQIGDFQVTVLSDGNMSASLELLKGITPSDAGQIQHEAGITAPGNIHINGYLIRGLGKTLLVDSGTVAGTMSKACSEKTCARLASARMRSMRCC